MEWISVKDGVPKAGKYVFAKHNRGTWIDEDDQENVNCVVVKLVKGISEKERSAMADCERKICYHAEDEHGNNLVPYYWDSFGSDSFFGQSIYCWMPIPEELEKKNV